MLAPRTLLAGDVTADAARSSLASGPDTGVPWIASTDCTTTALRGQRRLGWPSADRVRGPGRGV